MNLSTHRIISIITLLLIIPIHGLCNNSGSNAKIENLAPAGILYDDAKLLTAKENEVISDILSIHNSEGPGRISIFTIKELPKDVSIERYAYGLVNAIPWYENEKRDRILLLIAVKDRKLRIETSRDVWDLLTDDECRHIIKNVIAPEFKKERFYAGINSGLIALINELKQ